MGTLLYGVAYSVGFMVLSSVLAYTCGHYCDRMDVKRMQQADPLKWIEQKTIDFAQDDRPLWFSKCHIENLAYEVHGNSKALAEECQSIGLHG